MSNIHALQFIYGTVTGIYIAISAYLIFSALYLFNYKQTKTAQLNLGTAFSFFLFGLYTLFVQKTYHAVSTLALPDFIFTLGKYAAPIALSYCLYIYRASFNVYKLQPRYKSIFFFIYGFNAFCFIALFFTSSYNVALFICLLSYIPVTAVLTWHSSHHLHFTTFGKISQYLFFISCVNAAYLALRLYYASGDLSTTEMLLQHGIFALISLAFSFIFSRYGYDQMVRFAKIEKLDKQQIMEDLEAAIEKKQFFFHYQPQINTSSNTIRGFESLIRWQHPQKGILYPDDFIPLCEATGHINKITYLVIDAAIKQALVFSRLNYNLVLSLNFSSSDLNSETITYFKSKIKEFNVPAHRFVVEMTETVVLDDTNKTKEAINMLSALGVKIAMDDYGTGYSSLSYLNSLPLSELKIDKSFILDLNTNPQNLIVVESTATMAKSLGLAVIAEGVESAESLELLKTIGCSLAQGYYIAKPMTNKAILPWLRNSPYQLRKTC